MSNNIKEKEKVLYFSIWLIIIIFVLIIILNYKKKEDDASSEININISEELKLWFCCPSIVNIEQDLIIVRLAIEQHYLKVLGSQKKKVQLSYMMNTKKEKIYSGLSRCLIEPPKNKCEIEIYKPIEESIRTITLYLDNSMK